ncbi:hypothetical protein SLEP1_g3602 [Rubroshorea leprosula]|uniref:Uncharacterized protein n=1 Tax=Rubroshorea leprosula TaxID=152421 RepID=A0AAV5HWF1_9ROSI|nr:hypothetical protein SLEP1_g3602 [Rubroshorea leprosula]
MILMDGLLPQRQGGAAPQPSQQVPSGRGGRQIRILQDRSMDHRVRVRIPVRNPPQELLQKIPHHLQPAFLALDDRPESVPDRAQAAQLVTRFGARQR